MSQRIEHQYETILAMSLYVKAGIWTLNEPQEEITKEKVIGVFQQMMIQEIAKEASGNLGFNARRELLGEISVYQDENGLDYRAYNDCGLACIVQGLWGSIEGEELYLNVRAKGLNTTYFKYLSKPEDGFVSVAKIVRGASARQPNVRRLISTICSYRQAQVLRALVVDKDGKGLLEYPEQLREETIRASFRIG